MEKITGKNNEIIKPCHTDINKTGGFVTFITNSAGELTKKLRKRNSWI